MSLDLHDMGRLKVTPETNAWLEAKHQITGEEKSAIVRDLLHKHIQQELDVIRVADRLLRREGLPGILGEGGG
jgi:hypothetical protein